MRVGKGPGIEAPQYCGLQLLQKRMWWTLRPAVLAEPLKLLQSVAQGCDLVLPGSNSSPTDRQRAIKEQGTVGIS